MREYGGEINFICLDKEAIQFQSFSLCHSHCLAKLAFILDIYL